MSSIFFRHIFGLRPSRRVHTPDGKTSEQCGFFVKNRVVNYFYLHFEQIGLFRGCFCATFRAVSGRTRCSHGISKFELPIISFVEPVRRSFGSLIFCANCTILRSKFLHMYKIDKFSLFPLLGLNIA